MTATQNLTETIGRVFITALLLTGNDQQAEASVENSILDMDPDNLSESLLLQRVIKASLAPSNISKPNRAGELSRTSCELPLELQNVLQLPMEIRQSFVLRILIGLSVNECVSLLKVDEQELGCRTSQAALELASESLVCVAN